MARIKCATERCQEFAQAGTRYCHRLCQKSNPDLVSAEVTSEASTPTRPEHASAVIGMFDSTPPQRLHRKERRANGCNAKTPTKSL